MKFVRLRKSKFNVARYCFVVCLTCKGNRLVKKKECWESILVHRSTSETLARYIIIIAITIRGVFHLFYFYCIRNNFPLFQKLWLYEWNHIQDIGKVYHNRYNNILENEQYASIKLLSKNYDIHRCKRKWIVCIISLSNFYCIKNNFSLFKNLWSL